MAIVAKKYNDQLARLKESVQDSYNDFSDNYNRYHNSRDFVFRSSINEDAKDKLNELNKPPLEFNVLEAYISRLRGEFIK